MRALYLLLLYVVPIASAAAADRFTAYNETTTTDFTGVFLAPEGTGKWGSNEALNDKDKSWDAGERLTILSANRGRFDLKVVDKAGHVCVKPGLDLTNDTTFDVRDEDLATSHH